MTSTKPPTPREYRETAERLAARADRIASWNEQMVAAQAVIVTADMHGHGVIVSVSYRDSVIECTESDMLPAGVGHVFDRDAETNYRIRLAVRFTPSRRTHP